MAAQSTMKKLPAPIRSAVDEAIKRGATIDDIVALLAEIGTPRSRSAVGRYTKEYAELAQQQRDLRAVAESFGKEFGGPDDRQGRLLIQLLTSVATRMVMPMATQEDPELDGKELHYLARSVKDLASASKTDIDREAKIREEAVKATRAAAAEEAVNISRAAGASEETLAKIRAGLLGLTL